MGLTEEHVRLTTGAATAAVIRHGQVLVPKEGNEGRENHSDNSASAIPHNNAQQHRKRERQKDSQPSRFTLTELIPHPHSSSVLFFQKYIHFPQSSSCICTLHSFPSRISVASLQNNVNGVHPHLHSSSISFQMKISHLPCC